MWFIGNSYRCKNHFKLWRFIAIFLLLAVSDARKLKKHSFEQQKSSWRQQYTCKLIYKLRQNCSGQVNLKTY